VDDYEVICACGGRFTVRLGVNHYGCVRCCAEVNFPPLWLDLELAELDARELELSDLECSMLQPERVGDE
jgi:hypothetical protein